MGLGHSCTSVVLQTGSLTKELRSCCQTGEVARDGARRSQSWSRGVKLTLPSRLSSVWGTRPNNTQEPCRAPPVPRGGDGAPQWGLRQRWSTNFICMYTHPSPTNPPTCLVSLVGKTQKAPQKQKLFWHRGCRARTPCVPRPPASPATDATLWHPPPASRAASQAAALPQR